MFDQVATISINKYLDQNSLYLPRQIKKVKNTDLILDTQLDEQTRLMAIEKLNKMKNIQKQPLKKMFYNVWINKKQYWVQIIMIKIKIYLYLF